jgi:uncharacterized damage-inducible protein DinB
MQYYGAKQLASSFRTVRKNTVIIANDIPEEQYSFRPTPELRSVAEMLAHLAVAPRWIERELATLTEPKFEQFGQIMARNRQEETELQGQSKAQIIQALEKGGEEFATWLEGLSEETLAGEIHFPAPANPPSRTRFDMLLGAKEHEMHHRGQLMLIERLIGIVPHLTRDREAFMKQMMEARGQNAQSQNA